MNAFDLHNPATLKEAVALLDPADTAGRVKVLAGGQDLLTEMKEHIIAPQALVNIKHIPGMDQVRYDAEKGLHIGALVTISRIAGDETVIRRFPALAMAAESVASPQIRHVGTLGGNLCQRPRCWYYRNENIHCIKKGGDTCYAIAGENKYNAILGGGPVWIVHPSDTATALVALGAQANIVGKKAMRTVPLEKFFILPKVDPLRENVLKPDEILTSIVIPPSPLAERSVYLKFREKESMDFALSAVAVALRMDGKAVADARIVLGGVAPIPWRVPRAEAALKGQPVTEATLRRVADLALDGATPLEKNGFKVPLTKTLVRRAILIAAGLADDTRV